MTDPRDIPILFAGPMAHGILADRKTMTRRILKPQPDAVFAVNNGEIQEIYSSDGSLNELYNSFIRRGNSSDPDPKQFGLHGGIRRQYILPKESCRDRACGFSGLAYFNRKPNESGIFERVLVPQWKEDDEQYPSSNLHGISRPPRTKIPSDSSFGRQSPEQSSAQSEMGDAGGKLARSRSAREGNEGGEAPSIQINRSRTKTYSVGNQSWALQPAPCCADSWYEPSRYTRNLRWQRGMRPWVRETFAFINNSEFGEPSYYQYRADTDGICLPGDWPDEERGNPDRPKWRPSIHMPRWASRITLEVTTVRVERLQDISEADAIAEGIYWSDTFEGWTSGAGEDETSDFHQRLPVVSYSKLWTHINGADSWSANPWVSVTTFQRQPQTGAGRGEM